MATIVENLMVEHAVFRTVFDQVERVLPSLNLAREVAMLSTVVEGMLSKHAEIETDLAYAVLDHVLAEKGRLTRMHRDHREIDDSFKQVHDAGNLIEARNLLKKALASSRSRFLDEERLVFPLLGRVLPDEMLNHLGEARLQEYPPAAA